MVLRNLEIFQQSKWLVHGSSVLYLGTIVTGGLEFCISCLFRSTSVRFSVLLLRSLKSRSGISLCQSFTYLGVASKMWTEVVLAQVPQWPVTASCNKCRHGTHPRAWRCHNTPAIASRHSEKCWFWMRTTHEVTFQVSILPDRNWIYTEVTIDKAFHLACDNTAKPDAIILWRSAWPCSQGHRNCGRWIVRVFLVYYTVFRHT